MKIKSFINRFHIAAMLAAIVFLFTGFGSAVVAQTKNIQTSKPKATFDRVWVDYDVTENGKKGMRIHAAFSLSNMKGKDCVLLFSFEDGEGRLVDMNGQYVNNGDVAVSRKLKPAYNPAVYQDLDAFIPYTELELENGKYQLKIDVDVVYPNGDLLEHLTFHEFEYSQGETTTKKPSNVSVEFISKSVDYDITRDGQKGMLLHVKLDSITGLKGQSCELVVRILDAKDGFVMGDTPEYSDEEGNFEAVFPMKPAYDPAKYDDIQIFIPYSEISVGKGSHKLRLDIDMYYTDGTLIEHLEYHPFDFKR